MQKCKETQTWQLRRHRTARKPKIGGVAKRGNNGDRSAQFNGGVGGGLWENRNRAEKTLHVVVPSSYPPFRIDVPAAIVGIQVER